jgi:hypothetical protein
MQSWQPHYRYRPFYSHIWTEAEQREAWEGFIQCRTYGDYARYVDQGEPNRWLIGEMQSFYPIPYSTLDMPWRRDAFRYSVIGQAHSLDVDRIHAQIESETEHLTVGNTDYHCPGERPNFAREMTFLESQGMGRTTHITDVGPDNYPDLWAWAHSLGLSQVRCTIRTHLPGTVLISHCDKSTSVFEGYHTDVSSLPLNHTLKTPQGYYIVFILLALNDWQSGHMFSFEDEIWSFRRGQVATFDWANIRHSTANAGWSRRHLVRVYGITQDPEHWAFVHANQGTQREL